MPTLYVENVPDDVYAALRQRAKENRQSITAEVIALLKENVPTSEELERRQRSWNRALKIRSRKPVAEGPFPSSEEMQRQDRQR